MPFRSKSQQRWMFANHPEMARRWADETPNMKDLPEKKKKKRKEFGGKYRNLKKMQGGGPMTKREDYPTDIAYRAAVIAYMQELQGLPANGMAPISTTQQTTSPLTEEFTPIELSPTDTQYFQTGFTRDPYGQNQAIGYNPMNATFEEAQRAEEFTTTNPALPKEPKVKRKSIFPYGRALSLLTTGLSAMGNAMERGRQNDYDALQQSTLGMMNPMPLNDFQPNPYSLYAKYGGNIKKMMKKGGIHIKPENKGKFTEYCGGKVTSKCIEKGLNSPSPTIRKRANFARNARKWKN